MTEARDRRPGPPELVGRAWWLVALVSGALQLGCQAPAPASPPPQAAVAAVAVAVADRYDLERDEKRGGHTLQRHVGRSDADLRARLRQEPAISAASTYTDRITAERVAALALAQHHARIDQWLARQGPRPDLALDYHGATREPIGRSLARRGRQAVDCFDAVVVLRWDARGFYVLTSYPELSR